MFCSIHDLKQNRWLLMYLFIISTVLGYIRGEEEFLIGSDFEAYWIATHRLRMVIVSYEMLPDMWSTVHLAQ
ncbi:hypothetical protein DYP60_08900 [Sphaerochaeta halotolerans]|uniref:Uncharacterized protein n=1 Tax=Sphaerochaeta halotolerans TaxID=2293840 RepID=A0A372MHG9_9SPIR|nr:hypothetical protein DYP60_08900 [Sphaerochaeta halotolerans]